MAFMKWAPLILALIASIAPAEGGRMRQVLATSVASATSTGIPTTATAVSKGDETVVDIAVDGEQMQSDAEEQIYEVNPAAQLEYEERSEPQTWDEAPQCQGTLVQGEFVEDSLGRPWGWQEDASCAYKSYPAGKVCTDPGAPHGGEGEHFDEEGRLWDFQDGESCQYLKDGTSVYVQ